MISQHRLQLALASLLGLTVGDAFGERFFMNRDTVQRLMEIGAFYKGPWRFTDDTNMALSIVESLAQFGKINQDELAHSFAEHYENWRGYGPAMHGYLHDLRQGAKWQVETKALFNGSGSFGNGAAMRVAPLGAYFWDEPEKAAAQARLSAEVTHTHPEGIAGAIAVAVAATVAVLPCFPKTNMDLSSKAQCLFEAALKHTPPSEVRFGIERASKLGPQVSVRDAVRQLGNGSRVSAQDTVPFCLWCAARHLDNYEEALWTTVCAGGDRDTTCAIVGGIVAAGLGREAIPAAWRGAVEPWPHWFTRAVGL